MAEIGAKLYYEALTGQVIQVIPPRSGNVVSTSKEQDFQNYESLRGRVPTTVSHIALSWPYGNYAEDFAASDPVKVDVWTKKIYFRPKGTDPSTPAPELALNDRIGETEETLAANVGASALNAMMIFELNTGASASELAVSDLQARYAETAFKLAETEGTVEILKETMTALIAEIAELKSQSGSGE